MKKTAFSMFLMICSAMAHAQTASLPAPASPDAERLRIGTERARLETGFNSENAACYKKFLVNNCLDEVKERRRDALADLRRQENSLDEQERKARGAEQIRKTEEKASLEKQQEAADKRAEAQKDFASRIDKEKLKEADRATLKSNENANREAAANRVKANQAKLNERTTRQAAAAEELRKYNERQEQAKDRQSSHERDQLTRTKPPVKSLPQPE